MPKLKTNSGAAKRFKVTKNKKFKYQKSGRRHILEPDSPKTSRQSRTSAYVHEADVGRVKQMLPYR